MSFEVQAEIRGEHLIMTAIGPVTEVNVESLGDRIKEKCEELDRRGVIVDVGKMKGALPAIRLYEATQRFIRAVGPTIRVAYINVPPHWNPDVDKFSRDVAYNRGGSLEMFSDIEQAIEWLALTPADFDTAEPGMLGMDKQSCSESGPSQAEAGPEPVVGRGDSVGDGAPGQSGS